MQSVVGVFASEEREVAEDVVCGPDPERYVEKIREYASAGFDYVYLHQIGPEQEGFFGFCERDLIPRLRAAQISPRA